MGNFTSYINKSWEKFRHDLLAKSLYDIIKWGLLTVLFLGFPGLLVMNWGEFVAFIMEQYTMPLGALLVIGIVLVVLPSAIVVWTFRKRIGSIQERHRTDSLTGLKNDKGLAAYLPSRLNQLANGQGSLSVILIDIDDFKEFNKRFGPPLADIVLGKVGQLLGNDKRATDETFRLYQKGDEFLVVANDTNINDALTAAERKRKLIEDSAFEVDGQTVRVTVSCGITHYHLKTDTQDSIVERASRAKDEAKAVTGKNCSRMIS